MRGGAIDQRRVERAGASVAAKDQAVPMCSAARQCPLDDLGAIFACAGERDANRVEDGRLGPIDGLMWQILTADRDDLLGYLFDQRHGKIPNGLIGSASTGLAKNPDADSARAAAVQRI